MISRRALMPVLLAASVGGPYVASNAPDWAAGTSSPTATGGAQLAQPAVSPATSADAVGSLGSPVAAGPMSASVPLTSMSLAPAQELATSPPRGPGVSPFQTQTSFEGTPTYSIPEVFRFDITKEWVYKRWARKSTALAELDLFGIRVPLVTGTQLYDVAGSLTYYFGAEGRVQRISFRGHTGDTSQLVALVVQRYGLQAQPTVVAGEQLFQLRDGDMVVSELRTRPAAVLWSRSPHGSFAAELDLQDSATARPLPSRVAAPPPTASPGTASPLPISPPAASSPAAAAGALELSTAVAGGAPPGSPPAIEPNASSDEQLGWKAFFPRSRMAKPQIQNLDQGNLYQW